MEFSSVEQQYHFGAWQLELQIPDPVAVEQLFSGGGAVTAVYWSQVWPAAVGLCRFMEANDFFWRGRKVLEIAAGLGLPSLLAAKMGAKVTCTDYYAAALPWMRRNAGINKVQMDCGVLDWRQVPEQPDTDILLLSDINYAQGDFDALEKMIRHFLHHRATILISTPQRLVAKSFIERLAPFIKTQESYSVEHRGGIHPVSVLLLQDFAA